MAAYLISEELKDKIEEWLENYVRTTKNDMGEEYDAANLILFKLNYLEKEIPYTRPTRYKKK